MSRLSNIAASGKYNVETSKHSTVGKVQRRDFQTQQRRKGTTLRLPNTATSGRYDVGTSQHSNVKQSRRRNVKQSRRRNVQRLRMPAVGTLKRPGVPQFPRPEGEGLEHYNIQKAKTRDAPTLGRRRAADPQHPDPPTPGTHNVPTLQRPDTPTPSTHNSGILHRPEGSPEKPSRCDLTPPEPNAGIPQAPTLAAGWDMGILSWDPRG